MSTPSPLPPAPEWVKYAVGDLTLLQVLFWSALIIGLLMTLIKIWPALSQFVDIIDATAGLPAYIVRADKRSAEMEAKIDSIHHEVNFNNGTSVKDAVIRVETGVAGLHSKVDEKFEELDRVDNQLRKDLEDTQPSRRDPV